MGASSGLLHGDGSDASWAGRPSSQVERCSSVSESELLRDRIRSGLSASTRPPSQIQESIKLLGAGGIAGAFSKTCTAPLARLTILYQVQALQTTPAALGQLSLKSAFSHVVRREGLLALWKGNGVTVIHRIPYSAINFWAYERLTELWRRHVPSEKSNPTLDCARRLAAGGLAGGLACTVMFAVSYTFMETKLRTTVASGKLFTIIILVHTEAWWESYPLDLVRTRLTAQVTDQYYQGIASTMKTIIRDEGARGLYRGLGATLGQVAPALAVNYAAYESLRAYLMATHPDQRTPSVGQSLACGSIAGLISSTLTFPLDLVRRRMQLEGQRGVQKQIASYSSMVSSVYARQGFTGFYQGIVPEYFKVVPGVAIAFCVFEFLKKQTGVTVNKEGR